MNYQNVIGEIKLTTSGTNISQVSPNTAVDSPQSFLKHLIGEYMKLLVVIFLLSDPIFTILQAIELALYERALLSAFSAATILNLWYVRKFRRAAQENAYLYQQLSRFAEDLEDELEARTSDLQVAYIELERLNQTQTGFVSIASHELRTPLTLLFGYSEMLLERVDQNRDTTLLTLVSGNL